MYENVTAQIMAHMLTLTTTPVVSSCVHQRKNWTLAPYQPPPRPRGRRSSCPVSCFKGKVRMDSQRPPHGILPGFPTSWCEHPTVIRCRDHSGQHTSGRTVGSEASKPGADHEDLRLLPRLLQLLPAEQRRLRRWGISRTVHISESTRQQGM